MRKTNHKYLEKLVKVAYNKRKPLFVWGTTGIGKSRTIQDMTMQLAKDRNLDYNENIRSINNERNFSMVDIRISQLDPSDLRGLPSLDGDTTKWLPPNWLPKAGHGILFFDEMNLAPPSVQSACYQLILDRRLGDYILPDGWSIISAGNRMEDRAAIFEMAAPLQNRFMHIELGVPSKEDWTEWAIKNGVDTKVITFLNFKPSLLFRWDSKIKEKAFPTPRSWEVTSDLIKDIDDLDDLEMLAATSVGEGASMELASFIKLKEKIDIEAILANPDKAKLPEGIDLKYAVVSGVLEKYRHNKKILSALVKLSLRMEPEYAVMMVNMSHMMHKTHFENNAIKMKEFGEFTKRYGNYIFEASGN